jgi:hypothetical protein
MIRIDPTLSLVWRTPTTVQIGFPLAVVTAELTPVEEHLLVALRAGCNWAALYGLGQTLGISRNECERFVARFELSLEHSAPRRRVGIDGSGACAEALVRLLSHSFDVRTVNAASIAPERLAPDTRVHSQKRARAARESDGWRPDIVVVVSSYAITAARAGVWLRREIPHLGVVTGDRTSRVGPLVTAGNGPCLSCVEMQAMDSDPARAAMLAQLLGKPCGGESALVCAELATVVTRVIASGLQPGEVLELDVATGLWTGESISTCSRCSCRALPRSEMVTAA